MKDPRTTEPFRGPNGAVLTGSIPETAYLLLGGIKQWVMIRGESVSNPVLILLHGGPGFPETNFFRYYNSALEKTFTVVNWEQRGTGKSFARDIPQSSMTIDRFVRDLDELIDAVRAKLNKKSRHSGPLLGLGTWYDIRGPFSRKGLGLRRDRPDR